jgi:serine-type D-Ala-D-Ala carboxypeptidase
MNTLRPGSAQEAGISPERLLHLREKCAAWVAEGSTPAVIVLTARHGVIFLHEAWGKLGPEPDSPSVERDSVFGVASVSKPVTATGVMQLIENGQIGANQPLHKYLPEFQGADCEKITVRHLLTHTSGLPYRYEGPVLEAGRQGLQHEPGTFLAYSNTGYDLLGKLVERISGKPYNDYMRQAIFEPLGMNDSTFIHQGTNRERSLRRRPGTRFDWPEEMDGMTQASSTLWTTALDMGIFLQTFINGGCYGSAHLLSPATIAAMTRDQSPGLPREEVDGIPNQPQGFGWFMLDGIRFPNTPCLFSPQSYGHAGASGAFVWADPVYDLLGVFLSAKVRDSLHPMDLFVDSVMGSIVQ